MARSCVTAGGCEHSVQIDEDTRVAPAGEPLSPRDGRSLYLNKRKTFNIFSPLVWAHRWGYCALLILLGLGFARPSRQSSPDAMR